MVSNSWRDRYLKHHGGDTGKDDKRSGRANLEGTGGASSCGGRLGDGGHGLGGSGAAAGGSGAAAGGGVRDSGANGGGVGGSAHNLEQGRVREDATGGSQDGVDLARGHVGDLDSGRALLAAVQGADGSTGDGLLDAVDLQVQGDGEGGVGAGGEVRAVVVPGNDGRGAGGPDGGGDGGTELKGVDGGLGKGDGGDGRDGEEGDSGLDHF